MSRDIVSESLTQDTSGFALIAANDAGHVETIGVDIPRLVQTQVQELQAVLKRGLDELTETDREHRRRFKGQSLEIVFGGLEHPLEKLHEAVGDETFRQVTAPLMLIGLYSPGGVYDAKFLANYAYINLNDQLTRVPGIGSVQLFGAGKYAMRLWVKPAGSAEAEGPARTKRRQDATKDCVLLGSHRSRGDRDAVRRLQLSDHRP